MDANDTLYLLKPLSNPLFPKQDSARQLFNGFLRVVGKDGTLSRPYEIMHP